MAIQWPDPSKFREQKCGPTYFLGPAPEALPVSAGRTTWGPVPDRARTVLPVSRITPLSSHCVVRSRGSGNSSTRSRGTKGDVVAVNRVIGARGRVLQNQRCGILREGGDSLFVAVGREQRRQKAYTDRVIASAECGEQCSCDRKRAASKDHAPCPNRISSPISPF